MQKATATKSKIKLQRNPKKKKKAIKEKGYPSGNLPAGKELHHKKPVATGGKKTNKNTIVLSSTKHKQLHINRRKQGKI